jgi:hypothetical protein
MAHDLTTTLLKRQLENTDDDATLNRFSEFPLGLHERDGN